MIKRWLIALLLLALLAIHPDRLIAGDKLVEFFENQDTTDLIEKANTLFKNGAPDEALKLAKKSVSHCFENEAWAECYRSVRLAGEIYMSQEKYDEAIKFIGKTLQRLHDENAGRSYIAETYYLLGYIHKKNGDEQSALECYIECVKILEDEENPKGISGAYNNISIIYSHRGDFENALAYLQKAERINIIDNDKKQLAINYSNQGKVYLAYEQYSASLPLFQKAINIGPQYEAPVLGLSKAYLGLKDYEKALEYAEEAIAKFGKVKRVLFETSQIKAEIFSHLKDYEQSVRLYYRALELIEGKWREQAKIHTHLARVYEAASKSDKALHHYHAAQKLLIPAKEVPIIPLHFSTENIDLANGVWVMEGWMGKARVFQEKFKQSQNIQELKNALKCYEAASEMIDFQRINYDEFQSKTFLAEYALPTYESAIGLSLQLYEQTGDQSFLEKGFTFSQQPKSFALATTLQDAQAKATAGIPEKLLEKERQLKRILSGLNNKISQEVNSSKREEKKLQALYDKRFEAKRELQKLVAELEKNYLAYFQLKYENKIVSVPELQSKLLDNQTAIIDFFQGEKHLFITVLSKAKINIQKVALTKELTGQIKLFLFEKNNAAFSIKPEESFQDFTSSALFIYKNLLAPSLEKLEAPLYQLIIIPDGRFNALPFEALLTAAPQSSIPDYSPSNLQYLINDYAINYQYSAKVLLMAHENNHREKAAYIFGGFAPTFEGKPLLAQSRNCSELQLSGLSHNKDEVQAIGRILYGASFLGNDASKANFLSQASDFQILHFATHACMSDEDPSQHKVFFSGEEYLSAYEVYNLPLKAKLVVLSACETGTGQEVKGEGVMSMARGFAHAGAPSILSSLWSVADKSTAEIMQHFYRNLSKGTSKSLALRNAKLEYLKDQPKAKQHPFYWAAFVQVGEDEALFSGGNSWKWLLFVGFLVLGVFGLMIWRRGANRKTAEREIQNFAVLQFPSLYSNSSDKAVARP